MDFDGAGLGQAGFGLAGGCPFFSIDIVMSSAVFRSNSTSQFRLLNQHSVLLADFDRDEFFCTTSELPSVSRSGDLSRRRLQLCLARLQ